MDNLEGFVDEIIFEELKFIEIVGRGAFGVVSRAEWNDIDVAVKHIETESEKKAFITELKQLSRVSHPNIVHLYGACTKSPVCLVMEYAEGGSLYNVLHGSTACRPEYTLGHALSWCLQCAEGVEYLHAMTPKALIHRDLKPPNLLLVQRGTLLKICDFGTACDIQTYMTNNKGSAAWMAPEVFEGSTYSEKCDVFSWGIILWEVLSRRKPFEEIGGPAFRIMWAVHQGTRPPLIRDCPTPVENIMTKCWSSKAVERPSMGEVVRVMSTICQYVPGADQPIIYPAAPDTPPDSPPLTQKHDTVRHGELVPLATVRHHVKPVVLEAGNEQLHRMTSAPASLAASRESLLDKSSRSSTPSIDVINKRYSADLSKLEQLDIMAQGAKGPPDFMAEFERQQVKGHRRTGSYGNSPVSAEASSPPRVMHHAPTAPGNLGATTAHVELGQRSYSWAPDASLPRGMESLEVQLQPLAPCQTSPESLDIYHKHVELAHHYLSVQMQIQMLTQRKHELTRELTRDEEEHENSTRFIDEYAQLTRENEDLQQFYDNLKAQAEMLLPDQSRASSN